MIHKIISLLRRKATTWAVAALLPVPLILTTNPAGNADISCLYLGLASAYLAADLMRSGGIPDTRPGWWSKIAAIFIALTANLILFISLGLMVNVKSNFPFPLMASLSVMPAIGLVPWLILRVHKPLSALVLGAFILLAAKLTGCVVARIVYGPNFVEEGYVAGDWRTAKLMISVFWILSTLISLGLLLAGHWQLKSDGPSTRDTGVLGC